MNISPAHAITDKTNFGLLSIQLFRIEIELNDKKGFI
jgi:hypothetical protein